jgi:hypothetical protein
MKKIRKAITAQGDDETMNRKTTSVFMRGMLAALVISAVFAGSASASPAWNFNGSELTGSEMVMGGAIESSMTIPGLTTKCENFLYKLTIKNEAKLGKASLTEMPLYNCTTDTSACTVEPSNYIIIEGVKVGISYAGAECALGGFLVKVTGTAGGLVDNATETATFNSSSFKATKTELKALGNAIVWTGVFPTEAFEWHYQQALTVS